MAAPRNDERRRLMPGILEGIRVLDFGRYIAGPFAAMLLGDMGAEVIRIERRGGSEDRFVAPVTPSGEGAMFLGLNRNKKGLTLDPMTPKGQEIAHRLVATSDIVVVNLPINIVRKMRLDYDTLRGIKEDIILVHASAFGPDGPYANRVGFDTVVQAMSGAMSLTGFPGPPLRDVVPFEDFGTALCGAFGALGALFERQRSGQGQMVDVSLLSTGIMFMQTLLLERHLTGIVRQQQGNTSYHSAPADVYQTRDGWLLVSVIGQPMFRRWATLVNHPELIDDPRCRDDITRAEHSELINQIMHDWCISRTTDECIRELESARIPCGPTYTLEQTLSDPQVQARQLLQPFDYPGVGPVPLPATPVRLSRTPGGIRHRAPLIGEHTDEILQELGYTAEEIQKLRDEGVV
jgi:crotonobetainyl-CoA:carnitine CoA-transferase CaiB-like acyl-CoA transferase